MGEVDPPFGSYAPSAAQARIRRIAARLPYNYLGRKIASVLLGPAGGRDRRPFDVEAFEHARARLHPYDNICEKRVYLTPHHWDPDERAALADAIAERKGDAFVFVDVGANVGLYTLFAHSTAERAGVGLRAVCIEPDPELRSRLRVNLSLNGLTEAAAVFSAAAGASNRTGSLRVNQDSRGQSRISTGERKGDVKVDMRTLLSMLEEAGVARIDAMKLDIEGHERAVLEPFFADAPDALRPRRIIVETSHDPSLRDLIIGADYEAEFGNTLNAIFRDTRFSAD